MTAEKDIKEALKAKKALMGSRSVISAAKHGKLTSVIIAKNAPKTAVSDVMHYANISGIKTQEFDGNSMELGELCGKPFSILLLGIAR